LAAFFPEFGMNKEKSQNASCLQKYRAKEKKRRENREQRESVPNCTVFFSGALYLSAL
jgi:hypothetical protein